MGMSHPLLLSPALIQGKLFPIYLAGSSFLLTSEASPFQRLSLIHQNVQQSGLLHITVSKDCMLLKLVRFGLIIYQQLLQVVFNLLSFHDSSSSCAHKKLIFLSFSPLLIASVRWSSKTGERGLAIGKRHMPVQAGTLSPSPGYEVNLVLVGHPHSYFLWDRYPDTPVAASHPLALQQTLCHTPFSRKWFQRQMGLNVISDLIFG